MTSTLFHFRALDPGIPLGVAQREVHVTVLSEAGKHASFGQLDAIDDLTLGVDDEIDRTGIADRTRGAHPEISLEVSTRRSGGERRAIVGQFVGLDHEAIFYDPESLVQPIRIVRTMNRLGGMDTGNPYAFIECVPNIYPVKGKATPVTPGSVIELEVPDMYGRPWAKNWEKYFEAGMKDPDKAKEDEMFDFGSNK